MKTSTTRLYNLDYLRGLAAFGIMIYHYSVSTTGRFTSETMLGRIGIYGVSVFYVLSGLTLFYVYHDKMIPTWGDISSFFIKRVFRIFPLLWLCTLITVILSRSIDVPELILNLTGLFGFVAWNHHIATGAWSIGNELVFYVFFPLFILSSKRSMPLFLTLSAVLLGIYLYFAFYVLDATRTLTVQFGNYSNPLNQVFLFLGGFVTGLFFRNRNVPGYVSLGVLLLGLGLFVFYPAEGNTVNLVTGWNRIVFTVACFAICFGFYKLPLRFPRFVDYPLTLLGEASYSVYLLHPIVYKMMKVMMAQAERILPVPRFALPLLSVAVTLVVSYIVYERVEKFFMRKGKELNAGLKVQ